MSHLTPRRLVVAAVSVVVLVAVLVLGDGLLLARRVSHVSVRFPAGGVGETWVVVGSDSRAAKPGGPDVYGRAGRTPFARADVVLVIHRYAGRTAALSVPRDLLVSPQADDASRLALTFEDGAQPLVDGLCRTLGVPSDHLVVVTMAGFVAAVAAVGGITVELPHPVRDAKAGLAVATSGPAHLGGLQALALVRSRHPEDQVAGAWVGVSEAEGAQRRTQSAGLVLSSFLAAARSAEHRPWAAQRVLWAGSGAVTTDQDTGLRDLAGLRGVHTTVTQLPALSSSQTVAVTPDEATHAALATAGFTGACTPAE